MGVWIPVIPLGKIAVERGNNGIFFLFVSSVPGPLSDARAAGIGQYYPAYLFKGLDQSIPFDGMANQLRTGRNGKF